MPTRTRCTLLGDIKIEGGCEEKEGLVDWFT